MGLFFNFTLCVERKLISSGGLKQKIKLNLWTSHISGKDAFSVLGKYILMIS